MSIYGCWQYWWCNRGVKGSWASKDEKRKRGISSMLMIIMVSSRNEWIGLMVLQQSISLITCTGSSGLSSSVPKWIMLFVIYFFAITCFSISIQ